MAAMALRLFARRTAGWLAVPAGVRVGRVGRPAPAAGLPWAASRTALLRSYAKKAGGGKGGGKGDDGPKADLSKFDLKPLDAQVKKSLDILQSDLRSLRVGAANPNLLDSVTLPAFGKTVPLTSVAQVSVRDAQTLWVAIFDPQLLEPAATAIRNAGLGLNPVTDKNALRVPIPKLTAEHRENLVKLVAKEAEKARAAIRNHRHAVLKDLKKAAANASEDEEKRIEKAIQKIVDDANKVIDNVVKAKTAEIQQR